MNKRSFWLGSLSAVVLLSTARAEDAVVADDPLQMHSANVCDAYGVGFAQVAGTNTCIKVSGQLRYEKHIGQNSGASHGRFSMDVETRSD